MNRLFKTAALAACVLILGFAAIWLTPRASAQPSSVLGPFYSDAFNFPADLTGTPDTRPGTWGLAGSQTSAPVVFNPPAGYRVRILRLEGNYMGWARGVYSPGNHVGTSWGILTTAPGGSQRVNFAADNCFAWLEYGLSNGEVNEPFNLDTSAGGLLQSDNTMLIVMAVYLNDQSIATHAETTFIAKYQFERTP